MKVTSKTRHGISHEDIDRLRMIADSRGNKRVRKGYTEPSSDGLTGLQVYDLRQPAIRLNPVVSILRNRIPRRQAPYGTTGIHWKAITGVNTGNILPGVSEGNRNAVIAQTTADYSSGYAGLGMEDYNTFEAKYGMREDAEAMARLDALESLINAEERVILGGNSSVAFGVAPTPQASIVSTGGALTAQAWIFYVVALTLEGKLLASVSGGVATTFSRTNADGSVDTIKGGSSNKSLGSSTVTSAGANSILVTWASVPGAAAYAVYAGTFASGTAAVLAAIVDTNEYLMTANPTGTQAASAITADNSANPLVFDGIITQLAKSGSGANVTSLDGDTFTVNAAGTFDELDAVFLQMWEASRLGPTEIMVNARTRVAMSKAVMAAGGGTPFIQVTVNVNESGIRTGIQVDSVLNPYTGQFIPFVTHPFMPRGMAVGTTWKIPYPIRGIRNVWEIETRQEYYSIKWPYRTRKDEFGVYVDEGLIGWTPYAHFLIQNIGEE